MDKGPEAPVDVVLAEPDDTLREGLLTILSRAAYRPIVWEDETPDWNLSEGVTFGALISADVPRWEQTVRRIATTFPGARIVVLLRHAEPDAYRSALRAGAVGCVVRDAGSRSILNALDGALQGETRLPVDIARSLASALGAPHCQVTPEDRLAIRLMAEGRTVSEMADAFYRSERDMYRYLADVRRRLGARDRIEAIALAARWGWLEDRSAVAEAW